MDHITPPCDSLPDIQVPIVDRNHYHLESLNAVEHVKLVNIEEISNETLASVLQGEMYFSLLDHFFHTRIRISDFIREDPAGTQYVALKEGLKRLLKNDSMYSMILYTKPARQSRFDEQKPIFKAVWNLLDEVETHIRLFDSPVPEIMLSVRILIMTLTYILGESWEVPGRSSLLQNRMVDNGWCPSHVEEVCRNHDVMVVYYLSRLRRPNPTNISHQSCSISKCVANNVELGATYQKRHVENHCRCSDITIDTRKVCSIIRKGQLPLVHISRDRSGKVHLQVKGSNERQQYIAISHVWSDGLGNPIANGLPQCQLEELISRLDAFPDDVRAFGGISYNFAKMKINVRSLQRRRPIWWDTLCIPVGDSAEVKDLKMRAINRMALIYTAADKVLVLDSEMQLARISASQPHELLARLTHCAWTRRSWTLQEGALASECHFQCADGVAEPLITLALGDTNLNDIRERRRHPLSIRPAEDDDRSGPSSYIGTLNAAHFKFISNPFAWFFAQISEFNPPSRTYDIFRCKNHIHRSLYKQCDASLDTGERYSVNTFCNIWNRLSTRNTTQVEDLLAIFANLLDLNSYKIMKLVPEERMKAIIRGLTELPVGLLYNDGPRLNPNSNHSNRWLPLVPHEGHISLHPKMKVNPDYLILRGRPGEIYFFDSNEDHYDRIGIRFPQEEDASCTCFMVERRASTDDELQTERWRRTVFIFEGRPTKRSTIRGAAIILTGASRDLSRLRGKYDCPVLVRPVTEDSLCASPYIEARQIDKSWELSIESGKDSCRCS